MLHWHLLSVAVYFTVRKATVIHTTNQDARMSRFTVALVTAVALALPLQQAAAHPRLVKSTPTANSHLAAAPAEIAVMFNENITLALSKLSLLGALQKPVRLDSLRRNAGDEKTLVAKTVTPLTAGRYIVKWQAAGSDGHPMRGEFSFVVDAPTAARKIVTPTKRP